MALTQIKSAQILSLDPAKLSAAVPIDKGGTNATTATQARENLGLEIGSDVQAFNARLADVAGLTATDSGVIVGNGSNFVLETGNTLRTSLGLSIGSDVQAFDAQLSDIAGLTPTDGNIIIGDGSNFILESGATARESLGLEIGSDVQAFDEDLAAIAALPSTADAIIRFTGTGSAGLLQFVDEDNMASNSATAIPSQQSVKAYVDSVASGLDVKDSVVAATTANIAGTYNAGNGTITAASNGALGQQDAITLTAGQRLLVKDQTDEKQNGIYTVTAVGDGGNPYVLTRATDFDQDAEVSPGAFTFVESGTNAANHGFVMSNHEFTSLNNTTGNQGKVVFSQFSGAGAITAGKGIAKSGSELTSALNELDAFTTLSSVDTVVMNDGGASGTNKQMTMVNFASGLLASDQGLASQGGQVGLHVSALQAVDVTVSEDFVLIYDHAGGGMGSGDPKKESVADLMTAVAGTGIIAASGVLSLDIETKVIPGSDGTNATFDGVSVKEFDSGDLGADTSGATTFGQVFVNGILQQGLVNNDLTGQGVNLGTYDYLWDADGELLYFNEADIDATDIIQVIYSK